LNQVFLAFFAVSSALQDKLPQLLEDALWQARANPRTANAEALIFALHAAHPALPELRRHFRPVCYHTIIYAMTFLHLPHPEVDERPAQPEAAIL
jgi:hypothetical protein